MTNCPAAATTAAATGPGAIAAPITTTKPAAASTRDPAIDRPIPMRAARSSAYVQPSSTPSPVSA